MSELRIDINNKRKTNFKINKSDFSTSINQSLFKEQKNYTFNPANTFFPTGYK